MKSLIERVQTLEQTAHAPVAINLATILRRLSNIEQAIGIISNGQMPAETPVPKRREPPVRLTPSGRHPRKPYTRQPPDPARGTSIPPDHIYYIVSLPRAKDGVGKRLYYCGRDENGPIWGTDRTRRITYPNSAAAYQDEINLLCPGNAQRKPRRQNGPANPKQ